MMPTWFHVAGAICAVTTGILIWGGAMKNSRFWEGLLWITLAVNIAADVLTRASTQ